MKLLNHQNVVIQDIYQIDLNINKYTYACKIQKYKQKTETKYETR